MDFYAILDQVIALLQQRGKASYRALKLQFTLDDASLDVLKDELIKVHQLARDHDGEMLVWTGETATAQAVVSPCSDTTNRLPRRNSIRRLNPILLHLRLKRNVANSRSCSVTWSTPPNSPPNSTPKSTGKWSVRIKGLYRSDPRYDGHIAQLLGDGLLVYFGYPQAHEDDAQRAVRTGLDIIDAMGDLNTVCNKTKVSNSLSVLGYIRVWSLLGRWAEQGVKNSLLGETPNIAARIQGLAAPNTC